MQNYFGMDIIPANDPVRLKALRRYEILDTPPEGAFNKIAELAARIFEVPVALISLVDEDRVWVKANVGIAGLQELDRGRAPCSMAILRDEVLDFPDASQAVCLMQNPLVAGDFGMRFYAGAPLKTMEGHNLGTLCIIDRNPKHLTVEDKKQLEELASIVLDEIELRLSARKAVRIQREMLGIAAHDMKNPLGGIMIFADLIKQLSENQDVTEMAGNIRQISSGMLKLIEE